MSDIISAAREELWEILSVRTSRKYAFGWTVFLVMFGVFIPMSQASYWINESQLLSLHLIFVPLMVTYACTTSSFAGAKTAAKAVGPSEFKNKELFLGKALAGFLFSYITYIFIVLAGIATLNYVIYMNGEWSGPFFYSAPTMFAFVFLGAGLVIFAVGTGVYVSLKVETLKTAQLLSSVFYLVIGLPIMSGIIKLAFTWETIIPFYAFIIIIDLVVFIAAMKMFKRQKFMCGIE